MLWNSSSVKLKPTWQIVHSPFWRTTLALKSSSGLSRRPKRTIPRFSLSERALLSPSLYLSYFELPEIAATRSKVAIALAMPSRVTVVPKTFWNCSS